MYEIPADEDWSFLVGAQLSQLCIGSYNLQLHFNDKAAISIQGLDTPTKSLSHKAVSLRSPAVGTIPEMAVSLISLLGARVLKVTAENSTTLALCFSNMEELRIFDCNDGYESFTINGGPSGVIVV